MAVKFSNNAKTLLSSGITSSATSISVSDASAWPTLYTGDYSLATLVDISDNTVFEIVKVTAISSNTLTVVRGQEGTTARAFNSGDKVELRLTAGLLEQALTGTDVVKLDSLTASATASYSLAVGGVAYSPANANALIVSLNGVTQEPNSAFTVSGSTITFSSALTANDSIDYIVDMAKTLDIGEPSDNTVSPDKLTSAVNLDAITDNGATTTNAVTVGDLTANGTVEFDGLSGTGAITVTDILDQDDMSSNSATALATQQSIKAYVDSQVDTADALPEVLANGNTTGGTDIDVSSGDDITFADNSKALFGGGSDLQIYHDGSHSFVKDAGTGDLRILGSANVDLKNAADGVVMLRATAGGSVQARHNGDIKLQTTSTGIDVTGSITFDGGTTSTHLNFDNNVKAQFGSGLSVYHSGSAGFIDNISSSSGDIRIRNFVNDADVVIQTDDGSGNIAQYFRADGSTGGARLYHYGSEKIATTSSGVEVTGAVNADTGEIAKPSTFWSNQYIGISSYGSIATQGNYDLHITSNGFRNSSGTWTSFGLNGKTGAAQIALDPDGEIGFNTNASKANGSSNAVSRRMTLSDSTFDVNVDLDVDGFMRSTGEIRSGTHIIAGRQAMGATGGEVALTINDGQGNANVTFNHTEGVPDQDGNSARIVVNTDSTSAANFLFELASNVTGGTTHHTTPIFRIDEQGVEVTGETHTDTLDVTKNVASTVIATMENANVTASHVLKLTAGGAGTGTKILECVGGAGGPFEVLGNGDVNVGGNVTATGNLQGTDVYVADQIIHTGDTNCYMQFHATDQWRVVTGGDERLEVNNTHTTVQNTLKTDEIMANSGQQLVLNAGESHVYATGQTGELVYINAEGGLQVNSSSNNWGGAWAGRYTASICNNLGQALFPFGRIVDNYIQAEGSSNPHFAAISSSDSNYKVKLRCNYAEEAMTLTGGQNYKILGAQGYSQPNSILFYASNDVKMKLKNNNQLLIGTTSAQGGTSANAGVVITDTNNASTSARLALKSNTNTFLRFARFGSATDSVMTIGNNYHRDSGGFAADNTSYGTQSITFRTDGELRFGTGAAGSSSPTHRMYISNTGALTVPAVYTTGVSGRDVYVNSSGVIGYLSSTRESKTNIEALDDISWLYDLNTVSFNYRKRDSVAGEYLDGAEEDTEYGLIAEEVEQVNPALCFYDENDEGEHSLAGVTYRKLIPVLTKAIQEQQSTIDALTQRIEQLEAK